MYCNHAQLVFHVIFLVKFLVFVLVKVQYVAYHFSSRTERHSKKARYVLCTKPFLMVSMEVCLRIICVTSKFNIQYPILTSHIFYMLLGIPVCLQVFMLATNHLLVQFFICFYDVCVASSIISITVNLFFYGSECFCLMKSNRQD